MVSKANVATLDQEFKSGSQARDFPFTDVFLALLALLRHDYKIEAIPGRHLYQIFYEFSKKNKGLKERFPLTFTEIGGEPYSGELERLIQEANAWGVVSLDNSEFRRIRIELDDKKEVLAEVAEDFEQINLEKQLKPVAEKLAKMIREVENRS